MDKIKIKIFKNKKIIKKLPRKILKNQKMNLNNKKKKKEKKNNRNHRNKMKKTKNLVKKKWKNLQKMNSRNLTSNLMEV
jgi:hypothetical protein